MVVLAEWTMCRTFLTYEPSHRPTQVHEKQGYQRSYPSPLRTYMKGIKEMRPAERLTRADKEDATCRTEKTGWRRKDRM